VTAGDADLASGATAFHNLSLGSTAAADHLRVLSFVEQCVMARLGREER
jgi:hypothetical protein